MTHPDTTSSTSSGTDRSIPADHNRSAHAQHTKYEQCTCSRHNARLLDLLDWRPDPDCPRHGTLACLRLADPTLDIDTSYTTREGT